MVDSMIHDFGSTAGAVGVSVYAIDQDSASILLFPGDWMAQFEYFKWPVSLVQSKLNRYE